jgi:hypothetical protein
MMHESMEIEENEHLTSEGNEELKNIQEDDISNEVTFRDVMLDDLKFQHEKWIKNANVVNNFISLIRNDNTSLHGREERFVLNFEQHMMNDVKNLENYDFSRDVISAIQNDEKLQSYKDTGAEMSLEIIDKITKIRKMRDDADSAMNQLNVMLRTTILNRFGLRSIQYRSLVNQVVNMKKLYNAALEKTEMVIDTLIKLRSRMIEFARNIKAYEKIGVENESNHFKMKPLQNLPKLNEPGIYRIYHMDEPFINNPRKDETASRETIQNRFHEYCNRIGLSIRNENPCDKGNIRPTVSQKVIYHYLNPFDEVFEKSINVRKRTKMGRRHRNALVYHSTGSGKSATAALLASTYTKFDSSIPIVWVTTQGYSHLGREGIGNQSNILVQEWTQGEPLVKKVIDEITKNIPLHVRLQKKITIEKVQNALYHLGCIPLGDITTQNMHMKTSFLDEDYWNWSEDSIDYPYLSEDVVNYALSRYMTDDLSKSNSKDQLTYTAKIKEGAIRYVEVNVVVKRGIRWISCYYETFAQLQWYSPNHYAVKNMIKLIGDGRTNNELFHNCMIIIDEAHKLVIPDLTNPSIDQARSFKNIRWGKELANYQWPKINNLEDKFRRMRWTPTGTNSNNRYVSHNRGLYTLITHMKIKYELMKKNNETFNSDVIIPPGFILLTATPSPRSAMDGFNLVRLIVPHEEILTMFSRIIPAKYVENKNYVNFILETLNDVSFNKRDGKLDSNATYRDSLVKVFQNLFTKDGKLTNDFKRSLKNILHGVISCYQMSGDPSRIAQPRFLEPDTKVFVTCTQAKEIGSAIFSSTNDDRKKRISRHSLKQKPGMFNALRIAAKSSCGVFTFTNKMVKYNDLNNNRKKKVNNRNKSNKNAKRSNKRNQRKAKPLQSVIEKSLMTLDIPLEDIGISKSSIEEITNGENYNAHLDETMFQVDVNDDNMEDEKFTEEIDKENILDVFSEMNDEQNDSSIHEKVSKLVMKNLMKPRIKYGRIIDYPNLRKFSPVIASFVCQLSKEIKRNKQRVTNSHMRNLKQYVFMQSETKGNSDARGVDIVAKILTLLGFTRINPTKRIDETSNDDDDDDDNTSNDDNGWPKFRNNVPLYKGFLVLGVKHSEYSPHARAEKKKILSYFNDKDNIDGRKCLFLINMQSHMEGLSLNNVGTAHMLGLTADSGQFNQALYRAIRNCQSQALPLENGRIRRINVFVYQPVFSGTNLTPLKLYKLFMREKDSNAEMKSEMLKLFQEVAFDKMIHARVNTNSKNILDDMDNIPHSLTTSTFI